MQATVVGGTPSLAIAEEQQASARPRLDSVDLLRGLVIVIMALDHARDFFTSARFDPTDLTQTTAPLFLTRWITHFCAPVFVFLAGTSAYLYQARGKSPREASWFLLTRGLWLVVLEWTVIRWAWMFNFNYTSELLFVQVIWVIGVSMIVLAGLVHLPLGAVAALGIAMIAGHNLLDGVAPESLGRWAPLWILLHVQAPIPLRGDQVFFVIYPLVPWIGVMAAGYAFGRLLHRPAEERRRMLLRLGGGLTIAFLALRALNGYGDPAPWSVQESAGRTVLSFLNTTKYPPSLLFLLMALGPAIALLPLLERLRGPTRPRGDGLRSSAALLLRAPPLHDPCAGVAGGDAGGLRPAELPPRLAVSARGVGLRAAGGLRGLGRRGAGPVSGLPLVRAASRRGAGTRG